MAVFAFAAHRKVVVFELADQLQRLSTRATLWLVAIFTTKAGWCQPVIWSSTGPPRDPVSRA